MTRNAPILFVAGPTAGGKSALALALARAYGGAVINADAIQVYADLAVLSARPTEADCAQVPHHLYGAIAGQERYSAGRWARDAAKIIHRLGEEGRAAIVTGGTGLYFKTLEEGLSPIPDVPSTVIAAGEEKWRTLGAAAFYQAVIRDDPAMARLAVNDRQRLVRAWSVFAHSGRPLSAFQALPRQPLLDRPVEFRVLLAPPREHLYKRCDQRLIGMIDAGALEEVRSLLEKSYADDLPVMKALGVAEFKAHFDGQLSFEEAIALAQRNTRRFAKRQLTWFRNQAADWPVAEEAGAVLERLARPLNKTRSD